MVALVGLGTFLVAGGMGALGGAGCNGGDNGNGGGTANDASMDTSTVDVVVDVQADTGKEAGGNEAGPTEAGPTLPWPKVYGVNASPDAPPLRICASVNGVVLNLPALPDIPTPGLPFPGLFPGTGGLLNLPVDPSTLTLTLYAVNALKLANDTADGGPDGGAEVTCAQLIPVGDAGGGNYLTPNVDFWNVGTIKKGTLSDGNTYVVALAGCLPGEQADAGVALTCGSGYSTTAGNLALTFFNLDSTTAIDAGSLGAQFAHASTPWDYYATSSNITGAAFFTVNPADGGVTRVNPPLAGLPPVHFGSLSPMALGSYSGLTFDGTSGLAAGIVTPSLNQVYALPMPFPAIEQLTYGAGGVPEAGVIQNGKGFVFILVGDPQQPLFQNPADGGPEGLDAGGQINLHAAHFLAFPTSNP
jgi:hypothetical protein